jgi:chromosome segregation ATPase
VCVCVWLQETSANTATESVDLVVLEATQPLLRQIDELSRQLATSWEEHTSTCSQLRADAAASNRAAAAASAHARALDEAAAAAQRQLVEVAGARAEKEREVGAMREEMQSVGRALGECSAERAALLVQVQALEESRGPQVEVCVPCGCLCFLSCVLSGVGAVPWRVACVPRRQEQSEFICWV